MANKLKHFRIIAGKTQKDAAQAAGITQQTYQRWESSSVDIPLEKLAKLAKTFKTTKEALLGRQPPVMATLFDDTPENLQYYGEIAFHFNGGGQSLLLSISEEARSRFYNNWYNKTKFVTVKDLGNRTVSIRKAAISDIYLSSEAYDDYGPEHDTPGYQEGTPLKLPDTRDWEIIECIAYDNTTFENYAEEDVERVKNAIMITDQQYKTLVADGIIKPEELEAEKKKNNKFTSEVFELAKNVIYQLSAGQKRSVPVFECNLYNIFFDLIDSDGELFEEDSSIVLQSEGYHRTVFINPDEVDYISMPTHIIEKGRDEASATELELISKN